MSHKDYESSSVSDKKGYAFTLVELMIVIAIIGILAAALFPQLTQYLARSRDTTRVVGAKDINLAINSYQIDRGAFPLGGPGKNSMTSWSDDCIGDTNNWEIYIFPILQQYGQKLIHDSNRKWPFCYYYITPAWGGCPPITSNTQYNIIFTTEASRSPIGTLYSTQTEGGFGRYCLTNISN